MIGRFRILAVGLAGLLAACGDSAGLDRLAAGETGKVVAVRSGDVVQLDNGMTVRLAGVETPYEDEPGGAQAKADLSRLVMGRAVRLFYGGVRRDRSGRALAQLRIAPHGRWVEGALLHDGWARVRTFADNRALAHAMYEDEAEARQAKRGLWALAGDEVRLPQETGGLRGFQIVEGRVTAFTPTAGGGYLDFTSARNGFAVALTPEAVSGLASAGTPPASLAGRLIRVRGMLGWNGVMRIDHPEPIEILKEK